jgi:fibronectin-binding autotransporter adhesin
LKNKTFRIGNNNESTSFSGAISGNSGSLVKIGTGTLILTGSNTYTGTTTVAAGVLNLGSAAQTPVLTTKYADIQAGKLIMDANASGATVTAAMMQTSYNGGSWNAGHFQCSTHTTTKGLGWKLDSSNNATIMYTIYGDATLDGTVGFTDLSKVLANYGLSGTVWYTGDFNYDGSTNFTDLSKVLANYGVSLGSVEVNTSSYANLDAQAIQALSAAGFTVVPEPSSLVLFATMASAIGLWAGWRRRRSQG